MTIYTPRTGYVQSESLLDRLRASEDSAIKLEKRGVRSRVRSVNLPQIRRQ